MNDAGILAGKTPVRCFMNDVLAEFEVAGPVLDVGGGHEWDYHDSLGTASEEVIVMNLTDEMDVDLLADAERRFPFDDDSFETVLCLNTMQYLYEYRTVIREARRVLTDDGTFVVAAPFLQLVHGHPIDYQRFTEHRWRRELSAFDEVDVFALDNGPVSAAAYQLYPLLKLDVLRYLSWRLGTTVDSLCETLSGRFRDAFAGAYPLYYVIYAQQ